MKLLGVILTIEDKKSRRVKNILKHMGKLPLKVWRALKNAGLLHIYVTNKSVPFVDDMGFLHGQAPHGWPPGSTWDTVPGTYEPTKHFLIMGGGEHGSVSLALHETGHCIAFLLGYQNSPDLIAHHVRLYKKLKDPFYKQDGPGGVSGRGEMFAESIAWLVLFGRKKTLPRYDAQYVNWLERILKNPISVGPPIQLTVEQYIPGICLTGPIGKNKV